MLFTMLTELIYIRVMQKKVSDNLSYPFLVKKQKTLSNRNRSGKSDSITLIRFKLHMRHLYFGTCTSELSPKSHNLKMNRAFIPRSAIL